jgi:signal transduction histidine kinase
MVLANEHSDDPARFVAEHPKGQIIFPYLTRLGESLLDEQRKTIEDLENIQKSVKHINDIVSTQQDYARPTGIIELVPLAPIIDEAIRINRTALDRSRVEIARDPEEQPATVTDRHRVLQIMVNLIRNAQQAFGEIERESKCLTIHVLA